MERSAVGPPPQPIITEVTALRLSYLERLAGNKLMVEWFMTLSSRQREGKREEAALPLKTGCCGPTSDPSTTLLRSSGRDDKESVVAYRGSSDWDVWISGGGVA